MITKTQIPASEYTTDIVEKNGIFYVYLCPKTIAENVVSVYELSFTTRPTAKKIKEAKAENVPLYKQIALNEIEAYDISEAVNGFLLNETHCWLDKSTRVGLINSINIEKAAGKATTTLYFNGVAYTIAVDAALEMLSQLELYAIDCYKTTEAHKATVSAYTLLDDIIAFDITEGYPTQLSFTI